MESRELGFVILMGPFQLISMIPCQCVGEHILGKDWTLNSDNAAVCSLIYTHINGNLDLYGFSIMS